MFKMNVKKNWRNEIVISAVKHTIQHNFQKQASTQDPFKKIWMKNKSLNK
jgi:hypothetical protein